MPNVQHSPRRYHYCSIFDNFVQNASQISCSSTREPTHSCNYVQRDRSGSGIGDVLGDLLQDRAFEFAVERAVFVATLHRIFVSGSDRDCSSWMEDYSRATIRMTSSS